MRSLKHLIIIALSATLSLASCKKDQTDAGPEAPKASLTLLKNSNWKVVYTQTRDLSRGILGGTFGTASFELQKEDELRWYLSRIEKTSYGGSTEIILNKQGVVKTADTESSYRPHKTIYGGDTWELQRDWAGGKSIQLFRNNQAVNISTGPGYRNIVNVQTSEDGLYNNSESVGNNTASHYHYGSGKWKANTFFAVRYTAVRYKNRTYVIYVNNQTSNDGIGVASESDRSETSQGGLEYFQMKYENHLSFSPVGFILYTAQYADKVYVSILTHQNKLQVYQISLSDFSIRNIVNESAAGSYSHVLNEIDPDGNLYVVEIRSENGKAFYSIRKYSAGGGSQVLLKEEDLMPQTQIQGIKYFAGKLHIALLYKEDVPDKDPNDNVFHIRYHMQLIRP